MKWFHFVILIVFISLVFYIAGAVGSGTFYIERWDIGTRMFVSFFWVFAVGVVTAAYLANDLKIPGK